MSWLVFAFHVAEFIDLLILYFLLGVGGIDIKSQPILVVAIALVVAGHGTIHRLRVHAEHTDENFVCRICHPEKK